MGLIEDLFGRRIEGKILSSVDGSRRGEDFKGVSLRIENSEDLNYFSLPLNASEIDVGQKVLFKYFPRKSMFSFKGNSYKKVFYYEILEERKKQGDKGYSWGDSIVQSI